MPFEVAGLLLTAALVGAIALAHREARTTRPAGRFAAGVPAEAAGHIGTGMGLRQGQRPAARPSAHAPRLRLTMNSDRGAARR